MKPLTSYETHRRTLQRKEQDALDFAGLADLAGLCAIEDARRIRTEILTMHFGGVTPREATHLAERVKSAAAAIDAAISARVPVEA